MRLLKEVNLDSSNVICLYATGSCQIHCSHTSCMTRLKYGHYVCNFEIMFQSLLSFSRLPVELKRGV